MFSILALIYLSILLLSVPQGKNIFVINQEILSAVPKASLLFGTNEHFLKERNVSILDSGNPLQTIAPILQLSQVTLESCTDLGVW